MILVRNLLQPLNGSKFLLLVFVALMGVSCGIFKDKKKYQKPRTTYKKPVKLPELEKLDTIDFQEDPIVEIPSVPEMDLYEKYGSVFKDQYRIGVILPLSGKNYLEDLSQLQDDVSFRFLNYYAGLLLALEDLENAEVSLRVEIINSSLKNNDSERLIRTLNLLDLDLVIGPYDRDLLKEIARYGRRKDIPVISPWQSSAKIATQNPNYVQLKPDIQEFYQAIVAHVDKHYLPEKVYLIGRENNGQEIARLNHLQNLHLHPVEAVQEEPEPYHMVLIKEDSLTNGETAFDSVFINQSVGEIAVILPNWSYRDEQFIYSCMRKLNAEKFQTKVAFYGMPIVIQTDKIGYNLYKNLNVRVAMDSYLNPELPEVKKFRERYFRVYGALPSEDAVEGYDMMLFTGRNLIRHGSKFQYFLPGTLQNFLQTTYEVQPKVSEGSIREETLDKVDYFENTHVEIRSFNHNRFEKMD